MRRISAESNSAGSASQSRNMSVASRPQKRWPPAANVGTPKMPAASARSPFAREGVFHRGSRSRGGFGIGEAEARAEFAELRRRIAALAPR